MALTAENEPLLSSLSSSMMLHAVILSGHDSDSNVEYNRTVNGESIGISITGVSLQVQLVQQVC